MKKTYTVTAYKACDKTAYLKLGDYVQNIYEAEEKIRSDDMERREYWRKSKSYNHGRVNPFKHHDYAVIECVGDAELDVEYEEYKPSFYELRDAVEEWREGEFHIKYKF